MNPAKLYVREPSGQYRPASPEDVLNVVEENLKRIHVEKTAMTVKGPESAARHIRALLAEEPREVFGCLFLDNKNHIIAWEKLFSGTIDSCAVYPRVVAEYALQHRATSIVLAHNHPGGDHRPSDSDKDLTDQIKKALELLDIITLDYIVVSSGGYYTFSEQASYETYI